MSSISNRDRKKHLQVKLKNAIVKRTQSAVPVMGMTITDVNVDLPPKGATPFFSQSSTVF